MSPLVTCSNSEKPLIECGTRLKFSKTKKNAFKYNALKICPIHMVSNITVIE